MQVQVKFVNIDLKGYSWCAALEIDGEIYPINYLSELNEDLAEEAFDLEDSDITYLSGTSQMLGIGRHQKQPINISKDYPEWVAKYYPRVKKYLKKIKDLYIEELDLDGSRARKEAEIKKKREEKVAKQCEAVYAELKKMGVEPCMVNNQRVYFSLKGAVKTRSGRGWHYNSEIIWHESSGFKITPEMIENSKSYFREEKYKEYKKAQGNKPCKSFEKWLATIS